MPAAWSAPTQLWEMSSTTSGSRRSSLASSRFSLTSAWTGSSTDSIRRRSSPGSLWRPASSASSTGSTGSTASAGCSHGERAMVIYCDTCSQPLCDECLVGDTHPGHNFKTMDEACQDQKNKLAQQLGHLRAKIDEQGDIQQWTRRQKEHLEGEIKQARDHLNRQYEKLTALLTHSMEQASRLLDVQRDSQRKPLYRLLEDTDRYSTQGKRLQDQIAVLKERIKSTSSADGRKLSTPYYADILGEIQAHKISVDMCNEFYGKATPKPKLDKLRMEALERSVQQVTEKVKDIFPRPWEFYQDITFSKDNAVQVLSFSQDSTKVTLTGSSETTSIVLKPEEKPVHILAKESFKDEGRSYWEVDMRGCGDWAVGVVELPQGKKLPEHAKGEHLGRDKSSWMLESIGEELVALHNDDLIRVKEQDVEILGVYLDISKKGKCELTFYNVSSCEVLHKFCLSTKKRLLYPVFSLFHQADKTPCLSLRHFGLDPKARNDSDSISPPPISPHSRVNSVRPDSESIEMSPISALSNEAESATPESTPTIEPTAELPHASETVPESPADSEAEFSSSTPSSLSASEPVSATPTDSIRASNSSTPTPALLAESGSVPASPVDSGRESNSSTPTPESPGASELVPESPDSGIEFNYRSTPTPAPLPVPQPVPPSPTAASEPVPPSPVDSGNGSAGSTPASSPTFASKQNWKNKFKGMFTRPSRK